VVIGISTLLFWNQFSVGSGLHLSVLGQVSYIAAFVMLLVLARLQSFDPALEEAALDLGASHSTVLRRILLPHLYPAIGAGVTASNTTDFKFRLATSVSCPLVVDFVLTVTLTGGQSPETRPFRVRVGNPAVVVATTLDGTAPPASPGVYVAANGTQTGRINRFSPAAGCGSSKANPGLASATGARLYDSYTFQNCSANSACIDVILDHPSFNSPAGNQLYAVAYSPSFDPANPATNFLADSGASGANRRFSLTAAPGQTFVVVVHEVNGGIVPSYPYTLTVDGACFPCTTYSTTYSCATGADLSITNAPSSPTITGGTNVTYTLGVANGGPNQADSVTVTYNLPSPLSFVSCLATNGGVCGGTGNNRTVTYTSLAAAASSTITMVGALPCSAPHGSVVSGTATVTSTTSDPDLTDNAATALFTVNGALPAPAVTAPGTVGEGSPNRTASVPLHAGSTYAWTVGNGTITAGQGTSQITFTAGTAGTPLTLSCIETNASACVSAPGTAAVTVGPAGTAVLFYTVPPCRVLDTRDPAGTYGGPSLQPGATRSWALASQCGIPSNARAVSANVTITAATQPGYLTLFPGDGSQPLASSINFTAGQTRANNAVLPVSSDGTAAVKAFTGSVGPVEFILDVNGFFR